MGEGAAGLMSREYPPHVYGGAGVHVEYLSRELAQKIYVEVHCWGHQQIDQGNLHVRGRNRGRKSPSAPRKSSRTRWRALS